MIILASHQQEHEVGDGTNFVIIVAGKLLEKAEALLRMVCAIFGHAYCRSANLSVHAELTLYYLDMT